MLQCSSAESGDCAPGGDDLNRIELAHDFFRANQILRVAERRKERLKFMLRERMKVYGTV
jgi:hypothetical protein